MTRKELSCLGCAAGHHDTVLPAVHGYQLGAHDSPLHNRQKAAVLLSRHVHVSSTVRLKQQGASKSDCMQIMFYAPMLFSSLGGGETMPSFQQPLQVHARTMMLRRQLEPVSSLMSPGQSIMTLCAHVVGAVNVVATIVAIVAVDRIGRKALFLQGGIQMAAAEVAIAGLIGWSFRAGASELTHSVRTSCGTKNSGSAHGLAPQHNCFAFLTVFLNDARCRGHFMLPSGILWLALDLSACYAKLAWPVCMRGR